VENFQKIQKEYLLKIILFVYSIAIRICGCSSAVEHHVANVRVVSSNLITRFLSQTSPYRLISYKNPIHNNSQFRYAFNDFIKISTLDNKDKNLMENPQQHVTEDLNLTIEKLPHCEVKFVVHAKPQLIAKAKEMAKKQIIKEVSIPGFRKGKAPADLIEKRYAGAIREKTAQELADLAFRKSQEIAKLPILNAQTRINYDLKSFDEVIGADMTYQFEVEPMTPSVKLEEIHMPHVKHEEVTEEKLSETIDSIRRYFSRLDVVKDRPAQDGDFVIIDIDDLDSNPPQKVFNKMRFEISDRGMAEWMKELLIGMSLNETKEGVSRPNSTDSDEIKSQYQPKKVSVTLHEIQEAKLPEVDENLAKKVGVNSVEEMKEALMGQLKTKLDAEHQDAQREKLCEVLLEHYAFDLPKSLIQREYEHRMNFLHNDKNFEKNWKKMSFDEQEAMKSKTMKESENAIKLFYLFRKVMLDHKVKLALPERKANPINMIEAMFIQGQDQDYENASEEQKAIILSKAMLSSAQDYLLEKLLHTQKA
jgi:trigger factor